METLLRDVRHGLRIFRKAGGSFIFTAVLTLAVGIGANTAIFSLVNAVLLKEPPFPRADRIVIFQTKTTRGSFDGASPAKFAHWARQTAVLTPLAWVIRTRGDPMKLRSAIEERLRQVTGLPVTDVRTMDEVVSRSTSRERFHMLLMSVFGGVSLMLAAIGIYGLMSYSVVQRTQEIGIRMALGAERGDVRAMVMRQGMTFAIMGALLGIAGAFAVAKQIASFLFGVTPWDPLVFGATPLVIIATAVLAVWWPATRATQVDPAVALRQG
jgi:FtsX-like permease family